MNAIDTKSLSKHFGDVAALSSLNLTVKRGEIFGFESRSTLLGAIDSTTLKPGLPADFRFG